MLRRVFNGYGKFLIFYAFDLDCQPCVTVTKAWGHGDSDGFKPISLGMFYMDSEPNRSWLLKSENPDVLAQISTVFVKAERRCSPKVLQIIPAGAHPRVRIGRTRYLLL